ncbi:MAG: DUF1326 domain-containing protein [Rhodospirillales bacterium]|jgi:hypothetical protein|nr:DUF1326 domain-containing protein [Rhodospirillales bacterium]
MSDTEWRLEGDYFETCNCDFLCPCPESHLRARPTRDQCIAAMAFKIDKGRFNDVSLDGLAFVVVLRTPGPMFEGGWTLGVIIDEQADDTQREALGTIASGKVGGAPGRFALVTEHFQGVEYLPIEFEATGLDYSLSIGNAVDQAISGVPGAKRPDEPLYLDNLGHPANSRLALAKATRSHIHAFGIDWDDESGLTNGHFAPFDWQGP